MIPHVKGAKRDPNHSPDPECSKDMPAMVTVKNVPKGATIALFLMDDSQPALADNLSFQQQQRLFVGHVGQDTVHFLADPAAYATPRFCLRIRKKNISPFETIFQLGPHQQHVTIDFLPIHDHVYGADLTHHHEMDFAQTYGVSLDDLADLAEFVVKSRGRTLAAMAKPPREEMH